MIDNYIDEWEDEDLLKGQFGTMARSIRNRARVKNSEILELLIYATYVQEQNKVSEHELSIMREDASYYYAEGIKEANLGLPPKKKWKFHSTFIPEVIFINFLNIPNALGYIWNEYVEGMEKYNADQIYRQAIIDIQQGKELDIDNNIYQNIIKKQQDTRLNVNGDKISGAIDLEMIGINNQAKLEGIKRVDNNAKVKFIAVHDKKTTEMCRSLDGQIFNIHDWNEFYRYSKINDTVVKKKCYGLIIGLNCPPIDDGFHWCRSSIMYLRNRK